MDGALSSGRYNREKDHGKINMQRNETRPDGGTKDRQRQDGGGKRDDGQRRDDGRRRDDKRDGQRRDDKRRDDDRGERRGDDRSRSRERRRDGDRDRRDGKDQRRGDQDQRRDGGDRRGDQDRSRRDDARRRADPAAVWGAAPADAALPTKADDPRATGPLGKAQRAALGLGVATGRNTESFDPASTLVRPSMRVIVASKKAATYDKPLRHDDVVIVPEFFCDEDDMALYYTLVEEMRAAQDAAPAGKRNGPEWQSWHEGAHLISKDPSGSATYRDIEQRMGDYFKLRPNSRGTRFNWYNNPSDWKPFHHDSAAFNPQRARNQNVTVGVSFGDTRELAFVDANDPTKRFYFPQTNGSLFYFGRDVNLRFKHGVNYQKEADRSGKGRISIILWGWADAVDEAGSPPMLTNDARNGFDNRRKPDRRDGPRRDDRRPRDDRRRDDRSR